MKAKLAKPVVKTRTKPPAKKPAPMGKARIVPQKPKLVVRPVPLMSNTIGQGEIAAALDTLRSGYVTQGPKVRLLETEVLNLLGNPAQRRAAMVNSGSSALLLAAAMLRQRCQRKRDHRNEVIIPAVCWSTTAAPFIQHGFRPIFVDAGQDYCLDPKLMDRSVTDRTVAIVAAHMIGNAVNMEWVRKVASRYDLAVIEDCCEATGVKWAGRPVGAWGDAAAFSFYYSHHLTTIEGGMLVYDESYPEVRAWREHGWTREYSPEAKTVLRNAHPELDARWVFDKLGWNLRSSDLNASIGLAQLPKLGEWQKERVANAKFFDARLRHPAILPRVVADRCEPSPFSYPVMLTGVKRGVVTARLEEAGVETRPVMTGNITRHPWYMRHKGAYSVGEGGLAQADRIHENAFLLPCRPGLDKQDLEHVVSTLDFVLRDMTGSGLA
jgi:CDP-6-deoxy-D-xylo-4-hexulose-3-dehydrase